MPRTPSNLSLPDVREPLMTAAAWQNSEAGSETEATATRQRQDKIFINKIVEALRTPDVVAKKEQHAVAVSVLRIVGNLLTFGRSPVATGMEPTTPGGTPFDAESDMLCNTALPPALVAVMNQALVCTEPPAADILTEALRAIGLYVAADFDAASMRESRSGSESRLNKTFLQGFFPLLPKLLLYERDPRHNVQHEALVCLSSFFICVGQDPLSSADFYQYVINGDVLRALCACVDLRAVEEGHFLHPLALGTDAAGRRMLSQDAVDALAELIHPTEGDVAPFTLAAVAAGGTGSPRRLQVLPGSQEGSTSHQFFDFTVRSAVVRALREGEGVTKMLDVTLRDRLAVETVLSVLKVVLEMCRLSLEFCETVLSKVRLGSLASFLGRWASNTRVQSQMLLVLHAAFQQFPDGIFRVTSVVKPLVEALVGIVCNSEDTTVRAVALLVLADQLGVGVAGTPFEATFDGAVATIMSRAPQGIHEILQVGPREAAAAMQGIAGSDFGYLETGLMDGCVLFLQSVVQGSGGDEYAEAVLSSEIWAGTLAQLDPETSSNALSPVGLLGAVKFVYEMLADKSGAAVVHLVADQGRLLAALVRLIRADHLKRLARWPSSRGGGHGTVASLFAQVMSVFYLPFGGTVKERVLAQTLEVMLKANVVGTSVQAISALPPEGFELPMGLLSRLVLSGPAFATQYVDAGGLSKETVALLVNGSNPSAVIVDCILIVSQLARLSRDNYDKILRSEVVGSLRALLGHTDASVRSKTCNLVGNLCRHSDQFYAALLEDQVLPELIQRCEDRDAATRKFACFALGNASFHSDALYPALEGAGARLVRCLRDKEAKTRANAAGALGNLVRNGGVLAGHLAQSGAIEGLVQVLKSNQAATNKIALFSLGNLCAYDPCREALAKLAVGDMLAVFASDSDAVVAKYAGRVLAKIGASS